MPTVPFLNQFMGGIADKHFFWRDWEVSDMENIDIHTSPKHIGLSQWFIKLWDLWGAWVAKRMWETGGIAGLVTLKQSSIHIWAVDKSSLFSVGAIYDTYNYAGSNSGDYVPSTNPYGFRHFVFTRANLYTAHYAMNSLYHTQALSGILDAETTSSLITIEGDLLFSRQNLVYKFDTVTSTLTTTPAFTLPQGVIVKYMSQDNWVITVVSTKGMDTYFHTVRYDGIDYVLDYEKPVKGYTCIDATNNNWVIWWVSTEGIHAFSWDNQFVHELKQNDAGSGYGTLGGFSFSNDAQVYYSKGFLTIMSNTYIWKYGHKTPWFRDVLTRDNAVWNIEAMSGQYVSISPNGISDAIYYRWSVTKQAWYVITEPFDAGEFFDKNGLALRVPFENKPIYNASGNTYFTKIKIYIQTDDTRYSNTPFIEIAEITETDKKERIITASEIAKKLETAWFSDIFRFIRIKFELYPWDYFLAQDICEETPLLYNNFTIKYEPSNTDF